MKTAKRVDLHADLMKLVRAEAKKHVQDEDGERCFNRFTFLEAMASRIDTILCGRGSPVGSFGLDCTGTARYLYCCLCLENGDPADGDTFQGMPILD